MISIFNTKSAESMDMASRLKFLNDDNLNNAPKSGTKLVIGPFGKKKVGRGRVFFISRKKMAMGRSFLVNYV